MKFSVLDLVYLRQGQTYQEAYQNLIQLANKAEDFGYERYWIAEHHNSQSLGSSATQIVIQHVLGNTDRIRVGSGGVMLPNHSPYLVAEQYGTIESLYPGRLDLGLGRAPGTDVVTAQALRRSKSLESDFEGEIAELDSYFKGTAQVHAYPAEGLDIPKYILGSSTDSAFLAAKLGLPYVFASHFAPGAIEEAIAIYRRNFIPSEDLKEPYVIVGLNAFVAETDEEAQLLSTTQKQSVLALVTGQKTTGIMPPKAEEEIWTDHIAAKKVPNFGPIAFDREGLINRERSVVEQMTSFSLIGNKETVTKQLTALQAKLNFDEIMVNSIIYDQKAQIKSYQLLAEVMKEDFMD